MCEQGKRRRKKRFLSAKLCAQRRKMFSWNVQIFVTVDTAWDVIYSWVVYSSELWFNKFSLLSTSTNTSRSVQCCFKVVSHCTARKFLKKKKSSIRLRSQFILINNRSYFMKLSDNISVNEASKFSLSGRGWKLLCFKKRLRIAAFFFTSRERREHEEIKTKSLSSALRPIFLLESSFWWIIIKISLNYVINITITLIVFIKSKEEV